MSISSNDADSKLRRSISHELGAVPLCVTPTFSSHLQESERLLVWIRELPIPHYVNLSISDHNDDEQWMPWSHTPSGPPLDVDSVFCMIGIGDSEAVVLALSFSNRVLS